MSSKEINEKESHTESQEQPQKIPGVVQVPLTRIRGFGHGPTIVSGPKSNNEFSLDNPNVPGKCGIKRDLYDTEGNKIEPIKADQLTTRPPEDKDKVTETQ